MLDPRGTKQACECPPLAKVVGVVRGALLEGRDLGVCTGKKGSKQGRDTEEFPRSPKGRAFQVHGTARPEVGTHDVPEST